MAESIVQDWLAEYASLQVSEMEAFVSMHENNQEIAEALYTIFNERIKYPELVHSVCNQFYSFYRSNEEGLKKFTMQFIPILIYIYLNSVAMGDKKNCRSVETLLISIYNVEVSTEDNYQKIVSFRMPILAQASIYHEEKSLHAVDLRRWEENSNRDVKWGPMPQIESINAQNRMNIMTALLFSYNQQLCLIQKSALFHLCRISSQIVNQGFTKPGHAHRTSYGNDSIITSSTSSIITVATSSSSSNAATATSTATTIASPKPLPRILLSSSFLIELVHAIYFAMFNGFGTIAIQTLEDIHHRGCYEMFTDLILVTNAVRNSLHSNPSGQPSDGPMGLSVALTPATNTVTVSKSMITNASFRTKKLPDDIPIQGVKEDSQQSNNAALTSITEENEQQLGNRNVGIRSSKESSGGGSKAPHKALIAGFKKSKDKDKDKERSSEKESKNLLLNKSNTTNTINATQAIANININNSSNNEILNNNNNNTKETTTSTATSLLSAAATHIQQKSSALLNKKSDKLANRNSLQMISTSIDSNCSGSGSGIIVSNNSIDYDKSSLPIMKNKIMLDGIHQQKSSPEIISSSNMMKVAITSLSIGGGGDGGGGEDKSCSGDDFGQNSISDINQLHHNLTNGSELNNMCDNKNLVDKNMILDSSTTTETITSSQLANIIAASTQSPTNNELLNKRASFIAALSDSTETNQILM